jgi:hypothetical protein
MRHKVKQFFLYKEVKEVSKLLCLHVDKSVDKVWKTVWRKKWIKENVHEWWKK